MAKFNDKPKLLNDFIENIYTWEHINLEEKLKEWKDQYPDRKIYLEFEPGSSCGCSYCSSEAEVRITATREETPEEIEERRKLWEEDEVKRKKKSDKKKKRTK